MRVAVLELPARWDAAEDAWRDVERLLSEGPADLALLPEAALSGYVSPRGDFDLGPFAEPLEGPTMARAREVAAEHGVVLAAPLIERLDAGAANAFVVVEPAGRRVAHYRKRHPWYPETWATAGALPYPTFDVLGARCTLAVCFDVHFVADEARSLLEAADVLLFPSAWVDDEPADARADVLGSLARRVGVTIVNANWGPGSPLLRGQGASRVVGPRGELARVESAPGEARRLDVTL